MPRTHCVLRWDDPLDCLYLPKDPQSVYLEQPSASVLTPLLSVCSILVITWLIRCCCSHDPEHHDDEYDQGYEFFTWRGFIIRRNRNGTWVRFRRPDAS